MTLNEQWYVRLAFQKFVNILWNILEKSIWDSRFQYEPMFNLYLFPLKFNVWLREHEDIAQL